MKAPMKSAEERDAQAEAIIAAVLASRKYAHLRPDTVGRIARRQLERYRTPGEALEATRRKLHQIAGAYMSSRDLAHAERRVKAWRASPPPRTGDLTAAPETPAICREVLGLHESTRERLPHYADFYRKIWEVTGKPRRLHDFGCGLNPFSWPWMDLSPGRGPGLVYYASDIDARVTSLAGDFLSAVGVTARTGPLDVLTLPALDEVDVALALKLLPVLEQQAEGSSAGFLARVRATHVVISFPLTSLGGRRKGMGRHYSEAFGALVATAGDLAAEFELPNELVYIVRPERPESEAGSRASS